VWGSSSKPQQRRHSDPMPAKTRLSAEEPAAVSPQCPDSAMTSGQSPFAYVTVAPPGLGDSAELRQVQQHAAGAVQHAEDPAMRLIQSYPLSNPTSDTGSSLPSAASPTPDPAWHQQQHGKHGLRHHHGSGKQHAHVQQRALQQAEQQGQGVLQQQQQHSQQAQQQLVGQQVQRQDGAALQQQGQQQMVAQDSLTAAGSGSVLGALKSLHGSAAALAAAAAADAADEAAVSDGEASGEVFTPFDSPFYQDLTWAPSASVCGMDSNHGSFSVSAGPLSVGHVSSAAMAASGTVCGSDCGSLGSPFQHMLQLQQAGQRGGVVPGSGSVSGPEGSLYGPDPSATLQSSGEPVLREALTIAYQEGLTPMAAAAVEAVSVHQTSRRSISVTAQPGSRPTSFLGAGPQQFKSAGALPAGVWAQLSSSNGQGPEPTPATAAGSTGGGRQDVAASADNSCTAAPAPELAATAAASVVVEGLASKPHSHAAPAKSPVRSTTPVSDQQQPQLHTWDSLKDAPSTGAAAAAAGEKAGVTGEEAVQRPAWMRLLGIRRSLPGGA
jgi:hypothetical protein